jgi:hypothetical protein
VGDANGLIHYGIKGMNWGVSRKARPYGVSASVNQSAAKDAEEFARAQSIHGNTAPTRRIRAKIERRRQSNPGYKKVVDIHLSIQKVSKRRVDKTILEAGKAPYGKVVDSDSLGAAQDMLKRMGIN